jgi:hypothetical protein
LLRPLWAQDIDADQSCRLRAMPQAGLYDNDITTASAPSTAMHAAGEFGPDDSGAPMLVLPKSRWRRNGSHSII